MGVETVDVGGQVIGYRRSAGDGPAIVFLHGNSSSSRTWRQVLDGPVGQRYRCVAMDLPGHGASAPFADPADYSTLGYAAIVAGFLAEMDAVDAVLVGWSLGGHIALDALPMLDRVPACLIMGTPPISAPAHLGAAFLPNPAVNVGFTGNVSSEDALSYALAGLAPGSALSTDAQVADILATDPAARAGLGASIAQGRFADEIDIVGSLTRPLAVLHGRHDQLVSLDYLRTLDMPTLWRGAVQVIDDAGHSPQEENTDVFVSLLSEFLAY